MPHTFLQILLAILLANAAFHLLNAARLDDFEGAQRAFLIRAWGWSLPPVILWISLTFLAHGQSAPFLGFTVWIVGWLALHGLVRDGRRAALGLTAAWFVIGAGIAVQCDVGAFGAKNWGVAHSIGATIQLLLVFAGGWLALHRASACGRFFDTPLVKTALALSVAGIVAVGVARFVPAVRNQNPAWVLQLLAFTFGISIVAARIAASPAQPRHWLDWLNHWRGAIAIAFCPALMCLVAQDIAPATCMIIGLIVTFRLLHQTKAAWSLGAFALVLAYLVMLSLPSSRPATRVNEWLNPQRAASTQGLFAQQGLSRGGLIGGVGDWIAANGRHASTLAEPGKPKPRALSATALATTDGVWSAIGETVGAIGFVSILLAAGVVVIWLSREAALGSDLRARAFFAATAALFFTSILATSSWVTGVLPIAGVGSALLAGGLSNAALWAILLAVATFWSLAPPRIGIAPSRFAVKASWLERAAQAQTLRPLLAAFAVPLVLVAVSAVSLASWQREATLKKVFLGIHQEETAREAIWNGYIQRDKDQFILNEKLLSEDMSEQRYNDSQIKARAKKLRSWIKGGRLVMKNDQIDVAPRVFAENERSGLGPILAAVARDNSRRQSTR